MAYIEIEKVLETARNGYHSDFGRSMADLTSLQEVLEDTPTADVVEVVRCRDCKHYSGGRFCYYSENTVLDNDYCSYGERRDT